MQASSQPSSRPLEEWRRFVRSEAHVLRFRPWLLFQQAANQADTSPVRQAAVTRERRGLERRPWLHWLNRPPRTACLLTVSGEPPAIFSPDGRHFLAASSDHVFTLYDSENGEVRMAFTGHAGDSGQRSSTESPVAAFSPDASRIVTAWSASTARLWDGGSGAPVAVLSGHARTITSIAFSSDGRRLATGSQDGAVRVWDAGTGMLITTLQGHAGWVTCCAYSPDGSLLASACAVSLSNDPRDVSVRLWDAGSGTPLALLEGHQEGINRLAFSPDGRRLATASRDRTARLWDLEEVRARFGAEPLRYYGGLELRGHRFGLSSCAFSPDGGRVITTDASVLTRDSLRPGEVATLRIWDASNGAELAVLAREDLPRLSATAFSPDGSLILAVLDDRLRLFASADGTDLGTLGAHRAAISGAHFSPDGTRIISASYDGTVRIWDLAAERTGAVPESHYGPITACAFTPDGRSVVSASRDHTLRVWEGATGEPRHLLAIHSAAVHGFAISPDSSRLVSASEDTTVGLWHLPDGECVSRVTGLRTAVGLTAAWSPRGDRYATGSSDGVIRIWHATFWERLELLGHGGPVTACVFSPGGAWLLSASQDGTLMLWDATERPAPKPAAGGDLLKYLTDARRVPRRKLVGHAAEVTACAFSPDGGRIVSASRDHTLRLWDAADGHTRVLLGGHTGPVRCSAFSPDGTRVLSASDDGTLGIWPGDLGTPMPLVPRLTRIKHRAPLLILSGHQGPVLAAAWSPDGLRVASGSSDQTLRIWDAVSGAMRSELVTVGAVQDLAWSPDGTSLVAGTAVGEVLLLAPMNR